MVTASLDPIDDAALCSHTDLSRRAGQGRDSGGLPCGRVVSRRKLCCSTFCRELRARTGGCFCDRCGCAFCADALWLGCIRQARERPAAPVGVGITRGLQPFKVESGVGPRTDSGPGTDLFSLYDWWVVADGPLGHGGAPPWRTRRITEARSDRGICGRDAVVALWDSTVGAAPGAN